MFPFQYLERFPLYEQGEVSNSSMQHEITGFRGVGFLSPEMEVGIGAACRSRFSTYDRLVAIGLGLLAVISPLYVDRRPVIEPEDDEESISLGFWLPLLLMALIFTITGLLYLERRCARFDAYWIHRVGGSSGGILFILVVLAFILKCKAYLMFWESWPL